MVLAVLLKTVFIVALLQFRTTMASSTSFCFVLGERLLPYDSSFAGFELMDLQ
jgi:hypothetical protein